MWISVGALSFLRAPDWISLTIKKENSRSGIVEKFNIFDVGEVIEIVIVVRNEPSVVTNVMSGRTVYLTPVLLINLFHKSAIHLYPRRAYSNRITNLFK